MYRLSRLLPIITYTLYTHHLRFKLNTICREKEVSPSTPSPRPRWNSCSFNSRSIRMMCRRRTRLRRPAWRA